MRTQSKVLLLGLGLLGLLGLLAAAGVLVFRHVTILASELPPNSPAICKPGFAQGKQVVVAIGDSNTHGRVAANYVDLLAADPANAGRVFINAGINSELAWNALQRVDAVLACKPDVVTVMIGSNDVNARRSAQEQAEYIQEQKLPRAPDRALFTESLQALIAKLQAHPGTRVVLLSLPLMDEDWDSPANQMLREYNQDIQALAQQRGLPLLPVYDEMYRALKGRPANRSCATASFPMEKAVIKHFVLGTSWNQTSQDLDLRLLTDCLHLNEDGAKLVAGLIQGALEPAR